MGSMVTGIGVLDKVARVFEAVEQRPLDLAGLVAATGIPRATAHRLATGMAKHGLLRRDDEGRFALGLRLVALGRASEAALKLPEVARPALEALRDATDESVQLYVRDGAQRVCVASLESPHGLRTIVPLGAIFPLPAGSAGRILAAEARVGAEGWVASVEEREPGVASVSAAVHGADGSVTAAVSVSGPIERMGLDPGRLHGEAVLAAAAEVESRLRG